MSSFVISFDLMAIFQAGIIVSLVFKVSHIDHPTLSMEQLNDYGKVHPSLFSLYIGNIGYPDLVLSKDRKVLVQNITAQWIVVFAVRCNIEPTFSSGKQIIGPHYPGDPWSGNTLSLF
jgi:hypothetical protein